MAFNKSKCSSCGDSIDPNTFCENCGTGKCCCQCICQNCGEELTEEEYDANDNSEINLCNICKLI